MGVLVNQRFSVPLYSASVHVVVASDYKSLFKAMPKLFKENDEEDFQAMMLANGNSYGLAFIKEFTTATNVSHEVFHLTHRIMDNQGVRFEIDCHEAFAILHGHLFDKVWKIVRKHVRK